MFCFFLFICLWHLALAWQGRVAPTLRLEDVAGRCASRQRIIAAKLSTVAWGSLDSGPWARVANKQELRNRRELPDQRRRLCFSGALARQPRDYSFSERPATWWV